MVLKASHTEARTVKRFGDFRYVYHITDWGRTGRTIGVLVGVTIALVTFHAFFCAVARLVMLMLLIVQKSNSTEKRLIYWDHHGGWDSLAD